MTMPDDRLAAQALYRKAAARAKQAYPGPVGEYLSKEILSYEEWGYRIADGSTMTRLVNAVLETPLS